MAPPRVARLQSEDAGLASARPLLLPVSVNCDRQQAVNSASFLLGEPCDAIGSAAPAQASQSSRFPALSPAAFAASRSRAM